MVSSTSYTAFDSARNARYPSRVGTHCGERVQQSELSAEITDRGKGEPGCKSLRRVVRLQLGVGQPGCCT